LGAVLSHTNCATKGEITEPMKMPTPAGVARLTDNITGLQLAMALTMTLFNIFSSTLPLTPGINKNDLVMMPPTAMAMAVLEPLAAM
jgi:hypothetical protein